MKMDNLELSPTAKIIRSHFLDMYIGMLPIELQKIIYMYTLDIVKHPIGNMMKHHINKVELISRFELSSPMNFCDSILFNYFTRADSIKDMHTLTVLTCKKYIDKNIIHIKTIIDHDGYDQYGPESNLFDLHIYYQKKSDCNIYRDRYWREYWYNGDDDEPYELW